MKCNEHWHQTTDEVNKEISIICSCYVQEKLINLFWFSLRHDHREVARPDKTDKGLFK